MLNRIELTGKYFPPKELKYKNESHVAFIYFNLLVINPNNVTTILRCKAENNIAEQIFNEVKEGEMIKIEGYLESVERENITRILKFSVVSEEEYENKVFLMGEIIEMIADSEQKFEEEKIVSFKINCPSENGKYQRNFYFRSQGEMAGEVANKLQKGYLVLLEGFLQTKKIKDKSNEGKFTRISLIVLTSFNQLKADEKNKISKPIKRINFVEEKE